jgi:hypothetical protein
MISISEQRKIIEAELAKIRREAEQVHNDYLLYFIDMAIAEVRAISHPQAASIVLVQTV